MRKVITYGTFDLFHKGHYNLLKRAKELGDYLIVGVTTDSYDSSRGKLNVQESLMERINNVKRSGIADEIIIEEFEGQKIQDIQKHNIDIFAIGSDWTGKFDYLKEYCEVKYLSRTKGVSSTELRNEKNNVIKLGVVGYGRIANRFIPESKYVSGINVEGVFGRNIERCNEFASKFELAFSTNDYEELLEKVDAVYIATPHHTHYEYAKKAILNSKHVLCEKPMCLSSEEVEELYDLAKSKDVVLIEAIKTAYSPGFLRMVNIAKSGIIGEIRSVDATFTKLMSGDLREFKKEYFGGSVTELATYPLVGIIKLLGLDTEDISFKSFFNEDGIDLFTKITLDYKNAIATANVGLGVKSEGELVVSGTNGYVYVPAPWWKTEYFEVRFENSNQNKKYFYKFDEEGLRYEIAEFLRMINKNETESYKLSKEESIKISKIIEKFINENYK